MNQPTWFEQFWHENGGRLVFMGLYLALAVAILFFFDMVEEAKAMFLMISGLILNKARGNGKAGPK